MKSVNGVLAAVLMTLLMIGGVTAQEAEDKETEATSEEKKTDAPSYDLSIRFEEGEKAKYRMSQTNTISVDVMGEKSKTETLSRFEFDQECTAIDEEGNARIRAKYTRVEMKMIMNDETTADYDSETDEFETLEDHVKIVALLNGVELTMSVSEDGDVSDLKGYEEYRKKVREELGDMYGDMMDTMGSDDVMGETMAASYRALPVERVKIGSTWKSEFSMPVQMMGTMVSNATYELEAIEEKNGRECAKISIEGGMEFEAGEDAEVEMEYRDSEIEGTMWVDLETRETVYSENTLSYTLVMNSGTEITAPSKIVTRIELLEDEEADDNPDEEPGDDEQPDGESETDEG